MTTPLNESQLAHARAGIVGIALLGNEKTPPHMPTVYKLGGLLPSPVFALLPNDELVQLFEKSTIYLKKAMDDYFYLLHAKFPLIKIILRRLFLGNIKRKSQDMFVERIVACEYLLLSVKSHGMSIDIYEPWMRLCAVEIEAKKLINVQVQIT